MCSQSPHQFLSLQLTLGEGIQAVGRAKTKRDSAIWFDRGTTASNEPRDIDNTQRKNNYDFATVKCLCVIGCDVPTSTS